MRINLKNLLKENLLIIINKPFINNSKSIKTNLNFIILLKVVPEKEIFSLKQITYN